LKANIPGLTLITKIIVRWISEMTTDRVESEAAPYTTEIAHQARQLSDNHFATDPNQNRDC
jgi:hypothetical protein